MVTKINLEDVSIAQRLRNVTFEIRTGEFLGIVGSNGSGKSSLLRTAAGLLTADSGSVSIDSLSPTNPQHTRLIRQHTAVIHADPETQFAASSVFDEIAFGLRLQNIPRQDVIRRVEQTLARFELDMIRDVHPGFLSGGEQHLVVLAARLVTEPKFVLLDEVTAMLDVFNRQRLVSHLAEVAHREDRGIVLVTHRLEDLLQADRIAVMFEGSLVAYETPRRIMEQAGEQPQWRITIPPLTQLALDSTKQAALARWLPER